MSETFVPVVAIAALPLEPFSEGADYESQDAGISEAFGLTQLGAVYTVVPPGKSACPYHVHHVEDELFVILEGTGEYRFGDQLHKVGPGDLLGAPRGGAAFAHKLTNTGSTALKYLAISSKAETEVCEYPDSNKFLVRSQQGPDSAQHFSFVGNLSDEKDYWEGET